MDTAKPEPDEITRLRAENERLREELQSILALAETIPQPANHNGLDIADKCAKARSVLAGKGAQ